jgi:uncharacterized protein (UPF0262 family)
LKSVKRKMGRKGIGSEGREIGTEKVSGKITGSILI